MHSCKYTSNSTGERAQITRRYIDGENERFGARIREKENSLESSQSIFRRLDKVLKSLGDKLSASSITEHSMQVKVETSTPLQPGLQNATSKLSSPFSVCSGDPEH